MPYLSDMTLDTDKSALTPLRRPSATKKPATKLATVLTGKKRITTGSTRSVPVVMHSITLRVIADTALVTITVDGEPHTISPVTRAAALATVTELSEQFQEPCTVTIHEADGTIFADLLPAPAPRYEPLPRDVPAPVAPGSVTNCPPVFEIVGHGFAPGETVEVFLFTASTTASAGGAVTVRVPYQIAPGGPGTITLFGSTSKTLNRHHHEADNR